jgi:pyruvate kinase
MPRFAGRYRPERIQPIVKLADQKTKIIATIGPASESRAVMERLISAGMNVARLNFAHGDFDSHTRVIDTVRAAARSTGRRIAVMADLPGPKIRIGRLAREPIRLQPGLPLTLTTRDIIGDADHVSVNFVRLPHVLKSGDTSRTGYRAMRRKVISRS